MSYVTKQTLIDDIGESELRARTDRNNTGAIDDQVLNEAILNAASKVDGYLRATGHQLPLAQPTDPILRSVTTDLVRAHLWRNVPQPPEVIEQRRASAIQTLRDIKARKIELKLGETDSGPSTKFAIKARPRAFTDDILEGF